MSFRHFLLCLSLALAAAPVSADEPYVWNSVKVGGGGFTPNIVFSPVEKGLAYLRTDIGGAYRWDGKLASWIPLEDGIETRDLMEVESLAPDPRDANIVYLAAGTRNGAAILRSHDRGAHWEIFPTQFRMGGNEDGRGLGERLAVDPSDTSLLYFGSRNDGLQRSTDSGARWSKIASFPLPGNGFQEWGKPANAGLSFVIFVPQGEAKNAPTRTIVVGSADPGAHHLFRSDDAGATWHAIAGEPRAELRPVRAALDPRGTLYLAYSDWIGPNGAKDGAVFKLDLKSGKWSDITPDKDLKHPPGGYMALALDGDTVMVATLNRYFPHDTVWRSRDGGANWSSLMEISHRDVSASQFLIWGHQWGNIEADFGWWIAGLAIDPFDPGHVAYTTGATIYATDGAAAKTISWKPWVDGMEETAVLTVTSPPAGPHLLSGFGDIGGFAHDSLDRSPPEMFTNPVFTNTNTIDFAGMAPEIVVRSGTPAPRAKEYVPTLAYSLDSGKSWNPLSVPPLKGTNAQGQVETRRYDDTGDAAIAVSADGANFIAMTPIPLLTRDRGQSWTPVAGLPAWSHTVADRANPKRFYAVDFQKSVVLSSNDGGASFTPLATAGLTLDPHADWPTWREAQWPLMATPGIEGDLWFRTGNGRLFHSTDGGNAFREVVTYMNIEALGFGMAPPGKAYPALFSFGWKDKIRGVWRSDDVGKTWLRINDGDHQYGRRFRAIAGDPRVFGRVYLATDGRGVLYGDPAH